MRPFVFVVLACLLSFGTIVEAQTRLLYPQEQALKRQTMNMNEIERELDKQAQQGANASMNAAQEMLIAQFNQMLANDPNLKAQFDAATAEQQAAFMLQFGIVKPAAGQGDQFSFLIQRLDGIIGDLEKSNVPSDHPDVAALLGRVEAAKARISQLQQQSESKTEQAQAANDLSDYPDFTKNLETATKHAYAIRDALLASRKIAALANQQPGRKDSWLLENQINGYELARFKDGNDKLSVFENEVNRWTSKYQPLMARSQIYKGQWQEVSTAFAQIAAALRSESAQATQVLSKVIDHNVGVINYILSPDENDATFQRMSKAMLLDRVRNPGRGRLDGLSQARSNIELALSGFPINGGNRQKVKLEAADAAVDEAVAVYARSLMADQRMPSDGYKGDDRDELSDKAINFVKDLYAGADIHSVAVCCDWENVKYVEEIVEPDGRKWEQPHDYRKMQIAVAVIENDTEAKMIVVGVLQNFISNEELIEFLGERPMLRKNL